MTRLGTTKDRCVGGVGFRQAMASADQEGCFRMQTSISIAGPSLAVQDQNDGASGSFGEGRKDGWKEGKIYDE